MSSVVSKKHPNSSEPEKNAEDYQEEIIDDQKINPSVVTSHLYLKPSHSAGTLDREVVLRRIRHRKRVNNVKKAVQALLTSPFSPGNENNKVSVPPPTIIKWADDAFAAP